MPSTSHRLQRLARRDSLHPERVRRLRFWDAVVQVLAIGAVVFWAGLRHTSPVAQIELGLFVIAAMGWLTASVAMRYRWSLARTSFLQANRAAAIISALWLVAALGVLVFGPLLTDTAGRELSRFDAFVAVTMTAAILRGAVQTILLIRRVTAGATDPALVLVTSFLVLIAVGTVLLMLPRSRAETAAEPAGFLTALFTATSAACVTGLVVETTGTYWSPFGQTVIMGLFQVGGLGIMTCGAFFAVASGRRMLFRESATLRDMLESEQLGDVRRLVLSILVFTLLAELIGAVAISGLWADEPLGERIRQSVFHSVSAFCNAGFSLTGKSFVDSGHRWQVWGGVAGLIVIGSTGFSVLYDLTLWTRARVRALSFGTLLRKPGAHVRLSLTTRLAATTTIVLLIAGTAVYYLLESTSDVEKPDGNSPLAEAWFQSVTFRTAGFNTVDHGELQPATKLFAIFLMFIGASPGSTGGGVRTVCFALTTLALVSILRGRNRVEVAGRTIPQDQVNRALAIVWLGIVIVMTATILLTILEGRKTQVVDYMFEATSAFATVGVSTGITPKLSSASRVVIIVTMFVGRVGPLTVLMALAGRQRDARYDYPDERVTLG